MLARLAKILSTDRWHDTPALVAHADTANQLPAMSRQLSTSTAIMKTGRSVPSIRQQLKTNIGANAEGSVAPSCGNTWVQIRERSRLYTASITFWLARIMLVLAIRSFRSGILLLSDVKLAFRVSERLRRVAWSLLRSKRNSSGDHPQR